MSATTKFETTWYQDLLDLQRLGVDTLTADEKKLRRLPIADICTRESVFQPRTFHDALARERSEAHIRELAGTIETCGRLDAIAVLKIGGEWYCTDGHHRLLGYRLWAASEPAGTKKRRINIPVKVCVDGLEAALTQSVRENVKDRLCMTKQEKLEEAWKRTLTGVAVSEIVEVTTISRTTVFKMRAYLTKAKQKNHDADFTTWTWEGLQRFVDGEEGLKKDEKWEARLAGKWCRMLRSTFGERHMKHARVFALALHMDSATGTKEIAAECRKLNPVLFADGDF